MRSLSHPGAELDLCSPAMGFGRLLAWRWPVGLFAWMGSAGLDGTEQHGVLATSAELQVGLTPWKDVWGGWLGPGLGMG